MEQSQAFGAKIENKQWSEAVYREQILGVEENKIAERNSWRLWICFHREKH